MQSKTRGIVCLIKGAILALLVLFSFAQAHQQKAAITTVLFNPRTENIEIMHRFSLHDSEHAVRSLFDKTADIIDDSLTQAEFANYVVDRFAVLDANGESLPLKLVGYEIDGKHFWVYQETATPPALEGLSIQHDVLRDLWPAQVNTLNVEGKGNVKTLTFSDSAKLLEVRF